MKNSELTRIPKLFVLIFLGFISNGFANTETETAPLTRDLIHSFIEVTEKIGVLNQEYPELAEHSQQFNFNQSEKVIQFLKESAAYPKIQNILHQSEIDQLKQIFTISQKVMGGLYYLNRNDESSSQSVSQFEVIRKVLEDNLKTLRKQDAESFSQDNAGLIKESETQLKILDQQLVIVNQALSSLSAEDKAFLDANAAWFKKQFIAKSNAKE